MKKDYPKANARLAEGAKSWAEGEVSHEAWRKERRTIISALKEGRDWLTNEAAVVPKRIISASRATLPAMPVLPSLPATHGNLAGGAMMMEEADIVPEDALLLAVLLLVMLTTAILLLYIM